MTPKCEMLINCSDNFIGIYNKKYDYQTLNTKEIIDVKGQIWLTDMKYYRLST